VPAVRHFGSVVYGFLVFAGTALTGFVAAPFLAHAAGFFPIEVEARSAFSLVTLEAVPWLLGASVTSGFLWPSFAAWSPARRVAVWLANVLLVWAAGAAGVTLL
jgi:hypothetical protein